MLIHLVLACVPSPTVDAISSTKQPTAVQWYVRPGEGGEWDDPEAAANYRLSNVCDDIQQCIDDATAPATINVASGVYDEPLALEMKSGVDVVGAGPGATVINGSFLLDDQGEGASISRVTVLGTGTGVGIDIDNTNAHIAEVGVSGFEYGIQFYNSEDIIIEQSDFSLNDNGVWGDESEDVSVRNNVFRSNHLSGVTNWTCSGEIVHNTFVGNAYAAHSLDDFGGAIETGTDTEVIANNLIVSNFYGINCRADCENSYSHNLVWGNITNYINDAQAGSGHVNADPQFSDIGNLDFTLLAESPAVDAGTDLYSADVDRNGGGRTDESPDIGAYEFQVSSVNLSISEVMANPIDESTGEWAEIYNQGEGGVDITGWYASDGDARDVLVHLSGPTAIPGGGRGIIVDPDYDESADLYAIVGLPIWTSGETDNRLGNGMTTADEFILFESDGSTVAATFSYPTDPGNGVSVEMYDSDDGDVGGNWRPSNCEDGHSAGLDHCFEPSGPQTDFVITEIMFNPAGSDSGTNGEYIEIYNDSDVEIDGATMVLIDGSGSDDNIVAFTGFSSSVPAGGYALIVDSGYDHNYDLPSGVVLLTTADAQLGNGLNNTVGELVRLETSGGDLIDEYTSTFTTDDGVAVERLGTDDIWNEGDFDEACLRGGSPGISNSRDLEACAQALYITEVMSNALDEDTGEFVEIYNPGPDGVFLSDYGLTDGTELDMFDADGSDYLPPDTFAVLVDSEWGGQYDIPADAVLFTTGPLGGPTSYTNLGNGLAVGDALQLVDSLGNVVDEYQFPINAGNGVSAERLHTIEEFDNVANWLPSTCAAGHSIGGINCITGKKKTPTVSNLTLQITEVLANASDEDTEEFVEIWNYGEDDIDLDLFVLYDGDALDTLHNFDAGTVLAAGAIALVVDYEYAYTHVVAPDTLLITTDDTTIGSGLSMNDELFLYEGNGTTLISAFTQAQPASDGQSVELQTGAIEHWLPSTCSTGHTAGYLLDCPADGSIDSDNPPDTALVWDSDVLDTDTDGDTDSVPNSLPHTGDTGDTSETVVD
jgi:hypothetical protein